jgi:hypothetical protein
MEPKSKGNNEFKNNFIEPKNLNKIFIGIIFLILISCCQKDKLNLDQKSNIEELNINSIELFYTDYEIIQYDEVKMQFYENRTQMYLELKIINKEKATVLENSIEPIIFIHFNNKKYIAKGNPILSSSVPPDCDFFFGINMDGKILPIEDNIIGFIGFKNK